MKPALLFFAIVVIFIACSWLYLKETYPMTTPTQSLEYFVEHLAQPHANFKKYTVGFLPYWQLNTIQYLRSNELSEINYFSLNVGSDGHIITQTNGQNDPGWNGWIQQSTKNFLTKSQIMGAKITLTIANQNNDTITALLDSNTAQENLIADTIQQVQQRNLDGINIDFEYTGTPDAKYQQEFTYFSKKLSIQLKQANPHAILTLSIMPFSGTDTGLFDLKQLVPLYDYFVGMSYDYYRQNSAIAGPIAPMNGFKEGDYFFDVTSTYTVFQTYIPKAKLIMGIPYYGWEWAVEDGSTMNSSTYPADSSDGYAAIMSYARYREDTDIIPDQCHWDAVSEETWCWFTDKTTGLDHQAWPMDNKGIQTRLNFVNQSDLAGVAIWTLGQDKNYPDLWNEMQTTFGR